MSQESPLLVWYATICSTSASNCESSSSSQRGHFLAACCGHVKILTRLIRLATHVIPWSKEWSHSFSQPTETVMLHKCWWCFEAFITWRAKSFWEIDISNSSTRDLYSFSSVVKTLEVKFTLYLPSSSLHSLTMQRDSTSSTRDEKAL